MATPCCDPCVRALGVDGTSKNGENVAAVVRYRRPSEKIVKKNKMRWCLLPRPHASAAACIFTIKMLLKLGNVQRWTGGGVHLTERTPEFYFRNFREVRCIYQNTLRGLCLSTIRGVKCIQENVSLGFPVWVAPTSFSGV